MVQEILEMLKNIKTFTITNVYNLISNTKYKLQKNKNISYRLLDAPKFSYSVNREITRSFKELYSEVIDNFVSVLTEKLPESALTAMYHNLKGLKIGKEYNPIFWFWNGIYTSLNNSIKLNPIPGKSRGDATITHELLHMSSSIIGKNNVACGFRTGTISRSLNEGYTEVLNNRLFGHPITKDPFYNTYARVASIIEDIIGKENMTNLYFSADLKGLFMQLASYSSTERTSVFLKDLDSLFQFIGVGYNLNSKCLKRILNYLTDTTMNYINVVTNNGTLSPEEAKIFLQKHNDKITSIKNYIDGITRNKRNLPTQDNSISNMITDAQQEIPQQDISQADTKKKELNSHSNNDSYSYKFFPNNNAESPQIDSKKVRKKTKGNISYHFIFIINIILSILIIISYLLAM